MLAACTRNDCLESLCYSHNYEKYLSGDGVYKSISADFNACWCVVIEVQEEAAIAADASSSW